MAVELEEMIRVLQEEYFPRKDDPGVPSLEEFVTSRWGKGDDVYHALELVVKSCAEYGMKAFDDLPQQIRERIAENKFDLDQVAILDHYTSFGEKACVHAISQMEGTATRLTEAAFWKSLGLTPFAKFKQSRPQTYAEAMKAKWEAGVEAVRRANESRANKNAS